MTPQHHKLWDLGVGLTMSGGGSGYDWWRWFWSALDTRQVLSICVRHRLKCGVSRLLLSGGISRPDLRWCHSLGAELPAAFQTCQAPLLKHIHKFGLTAITNSDHFYRPFHHHVKSPVSTGTANSR